MGLRARSLLAVGHKAEWSALNAQERAALSTEGLSIEERLRRGQRVSAQAARLRRGLIRH